MDPSANVGTGIGVLLVVLVVNNYNPRWAQGKVELIKPKNKTLVNDVDIFSLTMLLPHITYHIF